MTARSTNPLGDNMTEQAPRMNEGELLHEYADRLTHWGMEEPTDERFAAIAAALIEMSRDAARKSAENDVVGTYPRPILFSATWVSRHDGQRDLAVSIESDPLRPES